jgi:hypothetical protein
LKEKLQKNQTNLRFDRQCLWSSIPQSPLALRERLRERRTVRLTKGISPLVGSLLILSAYGSISFGVPTGSPRPQELILSPRNVEKYRQSIFT